MGHLAPLKLSEQSLKIQMYFMHNIERDVIKNGQPYLGIDIGVPQLLPFPVPL